MDSMTSDEVDWLLAGRYSTDDSSAAARMSEIEAVLYALSPEERQMVELRIEGRNDAEIAEEMGLRKQQVEVLWRAARRRLRLRLNRN
jgi:DNA-directed RNA polymerase specialized sigma24 family protein